MNLANDGVRTWWEKLASTSAGGVWRRARRWLGKPARADDALPFFHTDPMTRAGLEVLAPAGNGLAFAANILRPGAWDVELNVEAQAAKEPIFLTWQFDEEELVTPKGSIYQSIRLRPGRHAYSFSLPLREGPAKGRLALLRAGDDGWSLHSSEQPLCLTRKGRSPSDRPPGAVLTRIAFRPPSSVASAPPSYLLLPITSFCNYKCVMCEHGIDAVPDRAHYPDALANQIIGFLNQATCSHNVHLTGLGESLMSPVFYRVVDSVRNPLVRFQFCSNGALLTPQRINWILASPISNLNVSLDAGSAATYAKIRRADWDKVVRNLEAFATALARSGRSDLRFMLNMTLMKENFHELEAFLQLARHLNAAAYVNQLNSYGHHDTWEAKHPDFHFVYRDQILYGNAAVRERLRRIKTYARDLGVPFKAEDAMRPLLDEKHSRAVTEPAKENELPPIAQCPYPWVGDPEGTTVVHADGNVGMCCLQASIGRVDETHTLVQIWNGPVAQEVRRDMLAGRIPQPCANANCWFVARQRALEPQAPGRVALPLAG